MKTCIIYLYREDNNTKNNLQFFVNQSKYDENCDYHLIINDHRCSVKIPEFFVIHRQENALDFPSYKTLINKIDIKIYDTTYFINSSCIGPFLPIYCNLPWYSYLNNILSEYDMIGPIIEMPPPNKKFTNNPFIHTYMFGFNKSGTKLFSELLNRYQSFDKDFCVYFERLLSHQVIDNNLKIKSLLTLFKNVDMNNKKNWNYILWSDSEQTCYEIPNNYHGIDINPYEIVFVKNIRNPHEHRSIDQAGISDNLRKQLSNYELWTI